MDIKTCIIFEIVLAVSYSVFGAPTTTDHQVAFSAGLTNTLHITDHTTVIYDEIYVNDKNGYDITSGVFTAPLPGAYVFHFHAYCTNVDTVMWLELHLNDKVVASVSGYNSHTVGSQTIILKLKQGDRIAVKSRAGQHFSLFGLQDQVYSTFTGFMLYPTRIYSDSSIG